MLHIALGHKKEVVGLASCGNRSHWLASLSKDGQIYLWDIPTETIIAAASCPDALCLVSSWEPPGRPLLFPMPDPNPAYFNDSAFLVMPSFKKPFKTPAECDFGIGSRCEESGTKILLPLQSYK